jgi:hypothetical protein
MAYSSRIHPEIEIVEARSRTAMSDQQKQALTLDSTTNCFSWGLII